MGWPDRGVAVIFTLREAERRIRRLTFGDRWSQMNVGDIWKDKRPLAWKPRNHHWCATLAWRGGNIGSFRTQGEAKAWIEERYTAEILGGVRR